MRQRVVTPTRQYNKEQEITIIHISLPGLLHDSCKLVLHKGMRTLSLLSESTEGPRLLRQQLFSDNELQVIMPLLEWYPHCCPYEVMLAGITSRNVTSNNVARWRLRLQEAQQDGTWFQELRPVRRALSSLRQKLHLFQLEISTVRERGCVLTSLASEPADE